MYRVTQKITDEQARTMIDGLLRGGCLKRRLWAIAPAPIRTPPAENLLAGAPPSLPLLCHEACNLLVAKARKVVKKAGIRRHDPPRPHRRHHGRAAASKTARSPSRTIASSPSGTLPDLQWVSDGPVIDLGEQVLLPGLINAHCHLDYTMMRHAISPPKQLHRVGPAHQCAQAQPRQRRTISPRSSAVSRSCSKWGTTSVCNIEAFPELMIQLGPSPIRTWWFYEMIDIRHRITTDDVVAGALSFFQHRANSLDSFGLSPHAPYTASLSLYQLANACAAVLRHAADHARRGVGGGVRDVPATPAGRSTSS